MYFYHNKRYNNIYKDLKGGVAMVKNNIKEYRKNKGFTQSDIANKLGIKQNTYSDKERGKIGFTAKELLILEKLLDASISDFYKELKEQIDIEM